MNIYSYSGPVLNGFDICLAHNWKAETSATSFKKARNNLAYRYKTENNLRANTKIKLPGHIVRVDSEER